MKLAENPDENHRAELLKESAELTDRIIELILGKSFLTGFEKYQTMYEVPCLKDEAPQFMADGISYSAQLTTFQNNKIEGYKNVNYNDLQLSIDANQKGEHLHVWNEHLSEKGAPSSASYFQQKIRGKQEASQKFWNNDLPNNELKAWIERKKILLQKLIEYQPVSPTRVRIYQKAPREDSEVLSEAEQTIRALRAGIATRIQTTLEPKQGGSLEGTFEAKAQAKRAARELRRRKQSE